MSHDARWRRIEELYDAATQLDESQRPAFLAVACGGDEALRREVESLLAEGAADTFLATPALELVGRELADSRSLIGQQVGPYRVTSLLGSGGMGEVYRARDPALHRDVAIKVLPAIFTSDPERLARFAREARLLASLNHPNIATIHGIERSDGVHALVLEVVEGVTLAERLAAARSGLSVADTLVIARHLVDALAAAHEAGIIHRDLKPANIKIRPDGVVKVLISDWPKP